MNIYVRINIYIYIDFFIYLFSRPPEEARTDDEGSQGFVMGDFAGLEVQGLRWTSKDNLNGWQSWHPAP